MTTAIVKQESFVPMEATDADMAYLMETFDPSDILIPRILLTQAMSKAVKSVKARPGDLLNSVELSKIGDEEIPVEFIPITRFKTWTQFLKPNGAAKFDFKGIVPFDKTNCGRDPRAVDMTPEGELRWDQTLNYYVILVDDFKAGKYIPYMLSCRMTSYHAGKQIAGHFSDMMNMRKMPFVKTLFLRSKLSKNKVGDEFYVFSVASNGRATTAEEYAEAKKWFDRIRTSDLKVDISEFEKDPSEEKSEDLPF